jgi:hypothetical protein
LLLLSRLLSHNYYAYGRLLNVVLDHADVAPQVRWVLRGEVGEETYKAANEMAAVINAHVNDTVLYYNILTDTRKPNETHDSNRWRSPHSHG